MKNVQSYNIKPCFVQQFLQHIYTEGNEKQRKTIGEGLRTQQTKTDIYIYPYIYKEFISQGNDFDSEKFLKLNPPKLPESVLTPENVMEEECAMSSSSRDGAGVLSKEVHKLCEEVQDQENTVLEEVVIPADFKNVPFIAHVATVDSLNHFINYIYVLEQNLDMILLHTPNQNDKDAVQNALAALASRLNTATNMRARHEVVLESSETYNKLAKYKSDTKATFRSLSEKSLDQEEWQKGCMSKGKSRAMRYLMKFSTAWYYLKAATWGGDYLECNIEDICQTPDAEVYFLHQRLKEWRTIKLVDLGNPLRCSAVELSHDFTKAMERIQFDAFSKKSHALSYLSSKTPS